MVSSNWVDYTVYRREGDPWEPSKSASHSDSQSYTCTCMCIIKVYMYTCTCMYVSWEGDRGWKRERESEEKGRGKGIWHVHRKHTVAPTFLYLYENHPLTPCTISPCLGFTYSIHVYIYIQQ